MTDQAAERMIETHEKALKTFLEFEYPETHEEIEYNLGWGIWGDSVCSKIYLDQFAFFTTFHSENGEVEDMEATY